MSSYRDSAFSVSPELWSIDIILTDYYISLYIYLNSENVSGKLLVHKDQVVSDALACCEYAVVLPV